MLLYDSPVSGNCYKVRLLLAHLQVPYERRTMDVVDRTNRSDVLGGLNPALRVPTLVLDDGRPLAESGAILWYLGEGTRFVPEDRYVRAQMLQWMFFEQYELEITLAVVRFWLKFSGRPEAFADQLDAKVAAGYKTLDAMERYLPGREFFVGVHQRWRTSPSTATRTSRTRAASTWRATRRFGAGSTELPRCRAMCRSTPGIRA